MVHAVWWIEEYTIHQTAHTDACKTYHAAYTAVSLRINPRGLEHVGNTNYKLDINL
jgi:hypothetical protein